MTLILFWATQLCVTLVTPIGLERLDRQFYFVWFALCLVNIPLVWFFYPETKNLSMEELERIWLNAGPLTAVKESYRLIHEKKAGGHVDFVDTHVDTEKKDTMDGVKVSTFGLLLGDELDTV